MALSKRIKGVGFWSSWHIQLIVIMSVSPVTGVCFETLTRQLVYSRDVKEFFIYGSFLNHPAEGHTPSPEKEHQFWHAAG